MCKERTSFSIEAYNAAAYVDMVARHRQSDHNLGLIFDIDETLVLTDYNHYEGLCLLARLSGHTGHFPTYEETVSVGEKQLFQSILGVDDEGWNQIKEDLRDSVYVNSFAPATDSGIPQIMTAALNECHHVGMLTAKPGTATTVRTAEDDMFFRLGLPPMPIYFRPPTMPLHQSAALKLDVMGQIQDAVPDKMLAIFDDSTSSAVRFAEENQARIAHGQKPLPFIVFDCPQAQNGLSEMGHNTDPDFDIRMAQSGIYVATWKQIPQTLGRIRQQWLQNQN